MMKYKLWLILLCFFFDKQISIAQSKTNGIIVFKKAPKDSLSFTNNWAYPAGVEKDVNGKFDKITDGEIAKNDTSHLFFTAHCRTNVQGGYDIRYCYAKRKAGSINLSFIDGEPAYENEFKILISEGKFSFTPEISYPELILGSKIIYKVTAAKLILYNKNYKASKEISGYIDAEFSETTLLQGKIEKHHYFLKGYFKAPVRS